MSFIRLARRTPRPSLKRARPEDAADMAAILADWVDSTPWLPRVHKHGTEASFAADMIAAGWVTVARRDGRVVGFLARDGAEIMALYVASGQRGRGIGTALIARAKRRSRRLALWTYQFNPEARAFYEAHGFVETARTGGAGNDEKLPDIRYEWTPAP